MNLSNIAILNINGSDYRCITSRISKIEAINLMHNTGLTRKKKTEHYKTEKSISHIIQG